VLVEGQKKAASVDAEKLTEKETKGEYENIGIWEIFSTAIGGESYEEAAPTRSLLNPGSMGGGRKTDAALGSGSNVSREAE